METATPDPMPVNPHRGEVAIALAGGGYVMRPTFAALAEIEAGCGVGLVELVQRSWRGDLRLSHCAVVVAAGIRGRGGTVTDEAARELVFATGLAAVAGPVTVFLAGALTAGRELGWREAGRAAEGGTADAQEADMLARTMGAAITLLQWEPEAFWRATPHELYAALDILTGEHKRRAFAAFRQEVEAGQEARRSRRRARARKSWKGTRR